MNAGTIRLQEGQIGRIVTIGESQGYLPLPVLYTFEDNMPIMVTAWFPTAEEIARLVAGAPVILTLCGEQHPPVKLNVGTR